MHSKYANYFLAAHSVWIGHVFFLLLRNKVRACLALQRENIICIGIRSSRRPKPMPSRSPTVKEGSRIVAIN
jgi:hypothetical protein